MAIANQITIYLKYNRVQASHEIRGTICRKVLDKTFDLEFFNCIHTVLYSKISRFVGDFTSHCGLSIYGCFLFIVDNKEKTFILFWGDISPYPLAPRIILGLCQIRPCKKWVLDSGFWIRYCLLFSTASVCYFQF